MDVLEGRISPGELAAFVFYAVIVGSAVGFISEVYGDLPSSRCHREASRIIGRKALIQDPHGQSVFLKNPGSGFHAEFGSAIPPGQSRKP